MSTCPRCGSENVTPIVYAASRRERRARQVPDATPGGPAPIDRTSPNFRCEDCGHAWPDQARLDAVAEIRSHFAALRAE